MKAPKCYACEGRHWSTQPCPAINIRAEPNKERLTGAINRSDSAINRVGVNRTRDVRVGANLGKEATRPEDKAAAVLLSQRRGNRAGMGCEAAAQSSKTPNRRKRKDYNAYMRDYMARRRHEP